MNERDVLAEGFEANRTHLRAVTYRMLGSVSEADDAEMYLHPQAQRYFHRLLAEMADRGSPFAPISNGLAATARSLRSAAP